MGEDLYKKQMTQYKKRFLEIRYNATMSDEEKRAEVSKLNDLVAALKKQHVKSGTTRMEPHNRACERRETRAMWNEFEEER